MIKNPPRIPSSDEMSGLIASLGKDQAGICWWCGAPADSREHKFKRTDLRRVANGDELIWGNDDGARTVRSHRKSKEVLFGLLLCRRCNDTRSQPFDRAYDIYAAYVSAQIDGFWRSQGMRLDRIFGEDWKPQAMNLARYFAKHFGCLMAESGFPPPENLRRFLSGDDDAPDFSLCFVKDEKLWLLHTALRAEVAAEPGLWISTRYGWVDQNQLSGYRTTTLIGHVGVQFEWHQGWGHQDSFFWHPHPVLNTVSATKEDRSEITKLLKR